MRKLLLLFCASSVAVAASSSENFIQKWGQLKLVENQLSEESGNPVQLKGWSTQELQLEAMNGCTGSEQWNLMHQYGANVVRLALGVDRPGGYLSDSISWKSKIKTYISEIANEGMYCVVDWNVYEAEAYSSDPNDFLKEAKEFFGEISKYCADNGYNHVLYEICNEPFCGWDKIKDYADEVIPVILENQPNALVILGTDSWSQKIIEPVQKPLDPKYKSNVLYSFHYYACSHFNLLGDFRVAQNSIPVFVSQWSAVQMDGKGPLCESNGEALMADCEYTNSAPQLVSWCFWNWGKGNEASASFDGDCSAANLSKRDGSELNAQVGEYITKIINPIRPCCPIDNDGPFKVQDIPNTTDQAWMWGYFDRGGEGVAYHDENSTAYVKDEDGNYIDYAIGDECDAYSLAYQMAFMDKRNSLYTLSKDGKSVVDYDPSVKCTAWDGSVSYLSLNAGKKYDGVAGSDRPDEGVDLGSSSLKGTPLELKGYNHLMNVEPGEWIKYTVNVAEPGYYKVQAYVSDEYQNGAIEIVQERGNIIRSLGDLGNKKDYSEIHFTKPENCADANVDRKTAPWDCWDLVDALDYNDSNDLVLVFTQTGEQSLKFNFNKTAGGVGPLVFTYQRKIDEIVVCCDDEFDSVDEYSVEGFSIVPNPTSGEFTVTLAQSEKATVDVVDIAGQIVFSAEVENSVTINKTLAPGIYTVVVKSDDGINTQKLVVK